MRSLIKIFPIVFLAGCSSAVTVHNHIPKTEKEQKEIKVLNAKWTASYDSIYVCKNNDSLRDAIQKILVGRDDVSVRLVVKNVERVQNLAFEINVRLKQGAIESPFQDKIDCVTFVQDDIPGKESFFINITSSIKKLKPTALDDIAIGVRPFLLLPEADKRDIVPAPNLEKVFLVVN